MLTPPSDEDVTTFEVLLWARAQGEFLGPTEMAVLYYLVLSMFTTTDNPEDARRGQVMYSMSTYGAIMAGTGIKSENTVRAALNTLQDRAYVYRTRRRGATHQPLRITVLYDQEAEDHREAIRAGREDLDPRLQIRPQPPKRKVEKPVLTLVQGESDPQILGV